MSITQTLTAPPTAPSRSQSKTVFDTNIEARLAWDVTNVTELTTVISQINAMTPSINNADTASDAALAAANFAGVWGDLTGPLTVPASVEHEGAIYVLLEDLADVTTSEPGVDQEWALIYGTIRETRTANTVLSNIDHGKLIDITSGTFSQTFLSAITLGTNWYCYLRNSGTGTITLDPDGSETIDGSSTKDLPRGIIMLVVSTGTALVTYSFAEPVGDHAVIVTTGTGHGSTNNKIRRYTTTQTSVGTAITYADSAGNGASFTINEPGLYNIAMVDQATGSSSTFGASVNSAQLTTAIASITAANRLMITSGPTTGQATVSITVRLARGDVVRPHTDGTTDASGAATSMFAIRKAGV